MIIAQVIEELLRAGVTGDALVGAISRVEAAMAEKEARYGSASTNTSQPSTKPVTVTSQALRQRRWRERKKAKQLVDGQPSQPSTDAGCDMPVTSLETLGGTIGGNLPVTDLSVEERKEGKDSVIAREAPELPGLPDFLDRTKPAKPPAPAPQRFEEFWSHYPKRSGTNSRKDAAERYRRAVVAGVPEQDIIAGVLRYAAWCDAEKKTQTEYVQQATTWLNQRNWQNEYLPGRKRQSDVMDAFDSLERELQDRGLHRGDDEGGGARFERPGGIDPPF